MGSIYDLVEILASKILDDTNEDINATKYQGNSNRYRTFKKYCKFNSCTPQYIYSPNSTGCSSFSFAFSTGVLSPAPFSLDVLPFSGLSVLSALSVVVFFAILFTGFSQTEMAAILSITMVTCKETAGYVWLFRSIGELHECCTHNTLVVQNEFQTILILSVSSYWYSDPIFWIVRQGFPWVTKNGTWKPQSINQSINQSLFLLELKIDGNKMLISSRTNSYIIKNNEYYKY